MKQGMSPLALRVNGARKSRHALSEWRGHFGRSIAARVSVANTRETMGVVGRTLGLRAPGTGTLYRVELRVNYSSCQIRSCATAAVVYEQTDRVRRR